MKPHLPMAALLALAAAPAPARQAPPPPHGDVVRTTDITYDVKLGYRPLKMTIYAPAARRAPLPIVVFLHGGGWALDPEGTEGTTGRPALERLARHGYVVAVPGYRLSGEAKFPAQLHDTKAAIRWIKSHAAQFGGDPGRVAAWGTSAGGHLAAMVATTCGHDELEGRSELPRGVPGLAAPEVDPALDSCVQAAVDWYGPVDFGRMDAQSPPPPGHGHGDPGSAESAYLGCTVANCDTAALAAANPVTYIDKSRTPPVLVMHGLADGAVPWQQSQELHDALVGAGVESRLVLVPGAGHMFDGLDEAGREAQVGLVIAWLDAHLRPAGR